MEILVIGNESNLKECQQKFGDAHQYQQTFDHVEAKKFFKPGLIIFDFDRNDVSIYDQKDLILFLNSVKATLAQLNFGKQIQAAFFGFCGLLTFLNREILEVSLSKKTDQEKLEEVCSVLNTKFAIVKDQVGLVTSRVIGMIINEAYFAIGENVASRGDIDLAMKLGTNYPFGPFEWCEKIGIENVCELLKAVHGSTKDERYRICKLLEA